MANFKSIELFAGGLALGFEDTKGTLFFVELKNKHNYDEQLIKSKDIYENAKSSFKFFICSS